MHKSRQETEFLESNVGQKLYAELEALNAEKLKSDYEFKPVRLDWAPL